VSIFWYSENEGKLRGELESTIQVLRRHAWDEEIRWPQVQLWLENFSGQIRAKEEEQLYMLYALSRFMYFGRRLIREMLRSLYRDHFESPMKQQLRRAQGDSRDAALINALYNTELAQTRFLGIGNPSESGAHLLYYFRQENRLPKNLFEDLSSAFAPEVRNGATLGFRPRNAAITRYVFFDDLVGSGTQVSDYLSGYLQKIRDENPCLEFSYLCLFGTEKGMERANQPDLFNGTAQCLFFLDESYQAFEPKSRYFSSKPSWFDPLVMRRIAEHYGEQLCDEHPLGYKNGQLLMSFSHNTPDNAPPIFWDDGLFMKWVPLFMRYSKIYSEL
jgi:hypothetical protein